MGLVDYSKPAQTMLVPAVVLALLGTAAVAMALHASDPTGRVGGLVVGVLLLALAGWFGFAVLFFATGRRTVADVDATARREAFWMRWPIFNRDR
jgi:uncharacterized membrane protein